MNNGVVIVEVNCHRLAFKKLLEVFPVVHFLVKLKAVVILVHLNLFGEVPRNGISAATTYLDNISA